MPYLTKFGEDLKRSIPGFIAVTITEIKTGRIYYSLSQDPNYDPELSSEFYLEIVRAKMNAITATSLKGEKIDTILVYLTSQVHLVDVSDNGEFFIYLTLSGKKNFNLGITQMRLNSFKKEIMQMKQKK